MSTRFDPNNCIAFCYYCHLWKFEKEKQGKYRDMMIELLGENGFKKLAQKAETIVTRRDAIKELMNWIAPFLKDMKVPPRWQWKTGVFWPDLIRREAEDGKEGAMKLVERMNRGEKP